MFSLHKAERYMLVLSSGFSLCTSLALLEIPSAVAHQSGFKDYLWLGAPVANRNCEADGDGKIWHCKKQHLWE